ncbi:PadR family transcriptional regulator [Parahaliea mediterranea]|uniref:PadR family transcriptional regulator n=1 Tax=Parahaliea mediterranea TaxID=651086 RepID=A0A939ILR1_9GAMM|nr:PadR family transcriptional regulator [Parahaliea mediterranea]MBN7796248.1 PadR family transcriptional regulator [Parahaliea mediterranea]
MALSHAIMTALLDDDMSGYELAKAFDVSLGLFWHASHQQIYQELRKLVEKGLLEKETVPQQGKPDKIVHRLTGAGREALAEWVWGESRVQAGKDDLWVKLYNLSPDNVGHLAAEIAGRRDGMMRRLYLYEKIRRRHYAEPEALPVRRQGVYLALLAGIREGEQFLAWCDEALALLAQVESANPARPTAPRP